VTSAGNEPGNVVSQPGRRVLVALVTGDLAERIQAWRRRYDPEQARRLPPHATLCYWLPNADLALLGRQVQHAFAQAVTAWLGGVREFDNEQHTFYVAVEQTAALDAARTRLFDGAHLPLTGSDAWTWHVTCVRESHGRDLDALRAAAASLQLDAPWRVDTVACLELRDGVYASVASWSVGK
jgi:hypothetical protein